MFHAIFSNQVSKLKYIKQNREFKFSFELEYSTMLLGEARFLLMDDCGNPLAVAIGSRLTRARHHVESILLIRSNIVGYLKNSHAFMCVSSGYTVYALLLSRCRVFCSFTGLTGAGQAERFEVRDGAAGGGGGGASGAGGTAGL